MNSLTHSLTTRSLARSLARPLARPPARPLARSLAHPLTHSSTHPLTHLLTHPLTHSPTHPLTHSHTHSQTHHLLTLSPASNLALLRLSSGEECIAENLLLHYNETTRTNSNSPGVTIRVPGWGTTTTMEYLDPSWSAYFLGNMGAYAVHLVQGEIPQSCHCLRGACTKYWQCLFRFHFIVLLYWLCGPQRSDSVWQ